MRAVQLLGTVFIGALWLASLPLGGSWWGIHFLGFLDPPLRVVCLGAGLAAVWFAPTIAAVLGRARLPRAAVFASLAPLAALLWLLRERVFFLGDGHAMLVFYDSGRAGLEGHALLTSLANYNLFRWSHRAFGVPAESVVGATSVLAGVLFALVAYRVCARRALFGEPWLARALLLSGGVMALFAGYVETYSLVAPVLLLYLGAGLDAAAGRRGLIWPFSLLLLAIGFHFIGIVLIPSFCYLALRCGPANRLGALGSSAALLAAAALLLHFSYVPGLDASGPGRHLLLLPGEALYRAYAFLSPGHLFDIANELLLLLPMGLPLLVWGAARRPALGAPGRFLAAASVGAVGFLIAFNAEIGFARDWDLFGFAALPLALLGACLWRERAGSRASARAAALVVAGAQLANTIPFILVNHDLEPSLARAQSLMQDESRLSPHARTYGAAYLGPNLGVLDRWEEALPYCETMAEMRPDDPGVRLGLAGALLAVGREEDGIAEARRVLELNPQEWRAHSILGGYYSRRGELQESARSFERSLALNPDDWRTRGEYGRVLVGLGRFEEGRKSLERALAIGPPRPEVRLDLGRAYAALGRIAEARRIWESLAADPRHAEAARRELARVGADHSVPAEHDGGD